MLENQINSILEKVRQLVAEHRQAKEQLQELAAERDALTQDLETKTNTIADLNNQLETIKLAKSLVGNEDNTDLKARLNQYLKEIDKCISLLNN